MDQYGKHRRYYTPAEVAKHNCGNDCWVSIFHQVYDITSILTTNKGPLAEPLVRFAGQDLSHWFDGETYDVKRKIDPETGLKLPHLPYGRFIHVAPPSPASDWSTDFACPWWRDDSLVIGNLSKQTRKIRVMNTLSDQETQLEVAAEETMAEILERYTAWNAHASSYTWKTLDNDEFRPLDMGKTLEENGILDESAEFDRLSIEHGFFYPALFLYYDDDLTVA